MYVKLVCVYAVVLFKENMTLKWYRPAPCLVVTLYGILLNKKKRRKNDDRKKTNGRDRESNIREKTNYSDILQNVTMCNVQVREINPKKNIIRISVNFGEFLVVLTCSRYQCMTYAYGYRWRLTQRHPKYHHKNLTKRCTQTFGVFVMHGFV